MIAAAPRKPLSLEATLALLFVVALGYYASGRLGLLLAIPPGYATAVWPASGIALASILLGGPRLAPGIFAGSFLVNIGTGFDTSAPVASSLLPALIAGGATLQALLGAWLVRSFVGYTNLLTQELDVIRILTLGGPLACTLNASVSVGSLWVAGKVPAEVAWINWFTWWVGDCIGVFVFTPLVLVWALRPSRTWLQRQLFVTLPLVLLYAIVVAVFLFVSQREQARIDSEFRDASADLGAALEKDLDASLAALGALEGFFAASENIEPYEFQIFAARLLRAMPGADGLSWDEIAVATGRVTVKQVVPIEGNEPVMGFDVASDPVRRAAMEQARDSGRVAASGSVALVQAPDQQGVLAFMPVYRHGVQPASLEARRRYVQGYAVAIFRLERLLAATAREARARGLEMQLYDDADPGHPRRLYGEAPGVAAGSLSHDYRFTFAGRAWHLAFRLPAATLLAHRSWATWLVLAGGLLLASLVGLLLLLSVGREARVEALVAARTAELRRLNADLTEEAARRRRLESEAERRAGELAESNAELQRRAEVNRQLLGSLRHSESELRRTASQLAASNHELEQFAYVASHDLKAPLRSIGSFAQLLERRYAAALGGESLEFLKFIQDGIHQMQTLIDDLLQLSRVDARRLEPGPVSMQQVVDRACRQLTADLDAHHAKVDVGALPEITADANMLVQLIQNLVGNALKFQKPGNPPRIWIEAAAEGDHWHFSVRDNGIGIDPSHLAHIFLVFKRLHTSDQFPGNGIGLAICKKVVNLHGGEIWAESAGVGGACFHFTLPRPAEERAAA